MESSLSRTNSINLVLLDLQRIDQAGLGDRFTEQEVWNTIRALPPDKAPGPDGFVGHFLQVAWPVIRVDLVATFDAFWCLDTRNFHSINEALMILLPKSAEAVSIRDYRQISLIHAVGKLFSKVLANHLEPKLSSIVHHSQSAFIQGRFIHDNFKFVQGSAKILHVKKVHLCCSRWTWRACSTLWHGRSFFRS
jgi:hypothetical protein